LESVCDKAIAAAPAGHVPIFVNELKLSLIRNRVPPEDVDPIPFGSDMCSYPQAAGLVVVQFRLSVVLAIFIP
jgi:hypothetical protein